MNKTDRLFHNILSFIVLFAASMMTVPVAIMLFTNQTRSVFTGAERIMPIFAVTATFIGYAVMYVFAKMTGKVSSEDGYAVQGKDTLAHFHVKHTVIPFLIYAVISALLYFLANSVFQILYDSGHMEYITEIYGIEVALIFFFAAVLGCVVWFYPMERLTNITVLMTVGVIFYAEMFFATLIVAPLFSMGFSVLEHPTVTGVIGPPFVIFTLCLLVVFNQSNMQRKFRGSVVAVITPSARMYNLFIVAMLLGILVIAVALMYVVISGISIILYAIFFVIAYKLFYGKTQDPYSLDADYVDSDAVSGEFQCRVMSPENQYLLALFFLLALAAAAVVVLAKTGKLKELILKIKTWFLDLLYSFRIGLDIFKNAPDGRGESEMYNYKDEKKLLQNAAIKDYIGMAEDTDSYKAFMQRLGKLKSYDEQLCYAYAVLLIMYKRINISLKYSDTPREVEGKVMRSIPNAEIEKITSDFEKIRYAEQQVSDAEAGAILNHICSVIKRYMY